VTALGVASFETSVDDALALGARALSWSESTGTPALVSAAFTADTLVLGKLQREDTLRTRSAASFDHVRRRSTTGTEAQLRGAVLYHALSLPRVDTLYPDASARTLLNRNLRAVLRGYAAAGVPLRYFGTEVLALLGHPVALVGYDQVASGAVLIEVLLGLDEPCVIRPALERAAPAALSVVMRRELDPAELLARAVSGIVERLQLTAQGLELPSLAFEAPPPPAGVPSAVSIPLGVVEAVTAPRVRFSGDLLVGCAALSRVEALAQAALDAGRPLTEAVLEPLATAPLSGARAADLLQALSLAS
jgi:hypothetical protein